MEEKIFTLKEYLEIIDIAYATGKAEVSKEEKEKLISHIKHNAEKWAEIVKNQDKK